MEGGNTQKDLVLVKLECWAWVICLPEHHKDITELCCPVQLYYLYVFS